jgi:hypothetical protein
VSYSFGMVVNVNTALQIAQFLAFTVFAVFAYRLLMKIHALTNSGMGKALLATVVALRSDADSKRRLAVEIGGQEQIAAANLAQRALGQAEQLLERHNRGQAAADRV